MRSRIMYIEDKMDGLHGQARIGKVIFSRTGKTLYYNGRILQSLSGYGRQANYVDLKTGQEYWISGCRKDGSDARHTVDVHIDEEVRDEYWTNIRKTPELRRSASFRCNGRGRGKYTNRIMK